MKATLPYTRAIVIGATSGIGRACAIELAKAGCIVGITGRRENLLHELTTLYPDSFVSSAFDATAHDALLQLEKLVIQMGGCDLFLFSSGWGQQSDTLDETIEMNTVALNVAAFTAIMGWAYRYCTHYGGHVAAISSVAGIRGSRFAPAYAASKAFQSNYLEALWCKAKKERLKIDVTDICPGFVDTAMAQGDGVFWSASVESAARQIVSALVKRKKKVYITKRWAIIALLLHYIPAWVLKRI